MVDWPTHTLPPNTGEGFVQLLDLILVAWPQVAEQADQEDQSDQPPWTVQFVTAKEIPVQGLPPFAGAGLLQYLCWHKHVSEESSDPFWRQ